MPIHLRIHNRPTTILYNPPIQAKKGIQFLINGSKVGNSPEEIAAFLKDASGLNKTDIN